jgi:ABC-type branched-subunit amino acid transport system ATPase component
MEIKESGLPCLIVEQKAAMVLEYSDYGYVLEMGNNRFEGKGKKSLFYEWHHRQTNFHRTDQA